MDFRPDIIQEQVVQKAILAVNVAAATGNVAKAAVMKTITGAVTFGEKAVVLGAIAGFIAFFLPWVSLLGTVSASGLRAAIDGSAKG